MGGVKAFCAETSTGALWAGAGLGAGVWAAVNVVIASRTTETGAIKRIAVFLLEILAEESYRAASLFRNA
jgi:hypothetical protein